MEAILRVMEAILIPRLFGKTSRSRSAARHGTSPQIPKILKSDVSVAKNYLDQEALGSLGRIVNAYLELAEDRAQRRIPMTMEDWAKRT